MKPSDLPPELQRDFLLASRAFTVACDALEELTGTPSLVWAMKIAQIAIKNIIELPDEEVNRIMQRQEEGKFLELVRHRRTNDK